MEANTEKPKFVSQRATGEGVPAIKDPAYSFDENDRWVFTIPEDVQQYLKSQFGDDIEIEVRGNEPQQASAGYCGYTVTKKGEVLGGIRLGGRTSYGSGGRTGVVSEWKLFKKQG